MKINYKNNNTFTYTNILIFIVILFIPLYQLRITYINTSISILTINLVILSLILLIVHRRDIKTAFTKEHLLWYLATLFIISFIPPLLSNITSHSLGVFIEWLFVPLIAGFLLFIHLSKSHISRSWIHNALLILLFYVSVISIIYIALGLVTFDGRLHAFLISPNHLAMFIAPLIFIVATHINTTSPFFVKSLSIITILLALITLFFTYSFGTLIALLLSGLLIIIIKIKHKVLLFCLVFFTLIFVFFVGYQKISHINPDWQRNSFASRTMIWDSTVFILQKNILISDGIDDFQNSYLSVQNYFQQYLEWSAPTPHNLLLTLWVSGGFFSVLFFCLLCSRWLYISLHTYNTSKNTPILLYVGALCTILLSSIIDTNYWKNDLSIIFWIIIALGTSLYTKKL